MIPFTGVIAGLNIARVGVCVFFSPCFSIRIKLCRQSHNLTTDARRTHAKFRKINAWNVEVQNKTLRYIEIRKVQTVRSVFEKYPDSN